MGTIWFDRIFYSIALVCSILNDTRGVLTFFVMVAWLWNMIMYNPWIVSKMVQNKHEEK